MSLPGRRAFRGTDCTDSRTHGHDASERPSIGDMSDYANRPDPTIDSRLAVSVSDATYDWRQKKTTGKEAAIRTGVAVVDAVIEANRDDRDH